MPTVLSKQSAVMDIILRSPLFRVWAIAIGVSTVARGIFRHYSIQNSASVENRRLNAFVYIVFNTFGMSFGMTGAHGVTNRSEQMIALFVSFFAILAGIFCTGIIFEQFTITSNKATINSVADFIAQPMLNVYLPYGFEVPYMDRSEK